MRAKFKISRGLKKKLRSIALIALDFDGVLTDNRVIHCEDGKEAVSRSRADSLAVDILESCGLYSKSDYLSIKHKLDLVILSREPSAVVRSVAGKIKIKCQNSVYNKSEALEEEARIRKIPLEHVLFIGNDLNDLDCLKCSGIGVAVADSHPELVAAADYMTVHKGGDGAFREICELILASRAIKPEKI